MHYHVILNAQSGTAVGQGITPDALAALFAEAGLVPRCVAVVTKNGWYDPVLGERVTWDRLRIRDR